MGSRFHVKKDGLPRIFFHKNCEGALRELVIYDTKKKVDDDAMDACRYLLFHNMPGQNASYTTAQTKKDTDARKRYVIKGRKVA